MWRRTFRWLVVLIVFPLLAPACTSGNLCNNDHPCGGDWECIEGKCGKRYEMPLCDGGVYCTRTCHRGQETGSLNPGDCPEPFIDCRQGGASVNDQFVCKANGIQPGLTACSNQSDCADTSFVIWME